MKRRRWIQAQWPKDLRTIAARLNQNLFGDDAPHGFLVDRVRDEFVEGRFIVKENVQEIFIDPFGREVNSSRLRFEQTSFILWDGFLGLELIDPPRHISLFRDSLSSACDFEVSFSTVRVDVVNWSINIERLIEEPIVISSIQISDIYLSDDVSATVLLDGSRDVRTFIDQVVDGKSYFVDKLKLSTKSGIRLILSRTGAAAFGSVSLDRMIVAARRSLASTQGL